MLLEELLQFTELIIKFEKTLRTCVVPGRELYENDVEHSYQLAMTAWYLNDSAKLGLNNDILIKFALVHDLVEAYTGDLHIFHPEHQYKKDNEEKALSQLAKDFPDFPLMVDWIREYERQDTRESQFIYQLDKLLPVIMIYLDVIGGSKSLWIEYKYKKEESISNKRSKIKDPVLRNLLEELICNLKDEMFYES